MPWPDPARRPGRAPPQPPRTHALVCGEIRLTYPELDQRTDRLAHALLGAGVGRGDRVVWLGQNCHRLVESWLAGAKIGAVVVPANWRQSADEMVTLLDDARPAVVIWQHEEIGKPSPRPAPGGAARRGGCHMTTRVGPTATRDSCPGGRPADARCARGGRSSATDPVLQLYTGAFGGTPNGALLSHQAILSQGLMVALVQRITGETVYLNSGPMFHMATLMTTFATFQMGGTNVLTRRVDAEELCRVIEAEHCNYGFVMGPTAEEIMSVNAGVATTCPVSAPSVAARPGTPWWRWTTVHGASTPPGTDRPR